MTYTQIRQRRRVGGIFDNLLQSVRTPSPLPQGNYYGGTYLPQVGYAPTNYNPYGGMSTLVPYGEIQGTLNSLQGGTPYRYNAPGGVVKDVLEIVAPTAMLLGLLLNKPKTVKLPDNTVQVLPPVQPIPKQATILLTPEDITTIQAQLGLTPTQTQPPTDTSKKVAIAFFGGIVIIAFLAIVRSWTR